MDKADKGLSRFYLRSVFLPLKIPDLTPEEAGMISLASAYALVEESYTCITSGDAHKKVLLIPRLAASEKSEAAESKNCETQQEDPDGQRRCPPSNKAHSDRIGLGACCGDC